MEKRGQAMLILAFLLMGLLIVKSLWLDPVGALDEEREKYKAYALTVAPIQNTSLLEKGNLLTYRVMFVVKEKEEGITEVIYEGQQSKEWDSEILEGQYRAKVRAYLLYVIPVKDLRIQGGIEGWKQH
ncbi:hypothetical protein SAMN05660297_03312 [Natronincola peptidivorans]|uniref:Uncharacterized protein n=1 Tax=Natronincola peptidivorans TaxID=426128 RepID=A0A1I0GQ06_9FIRM|nr:hypothetical protein [Natronincola peptidivorans]SET73162.1 hypothetical protein SAMN05660297_03312 [Natronincola peptidivorans]